MRRLVALIVSAFLCLCLPATAGALTPLSASLASPPEPGGALVASELEGEARFGTSLALSADGSTALVGAPGDVGLLGSVTPFTHGAGGWAQQGAKLVLPETPSEALIEECREQPGECGTGAAVALSADGDIALIGAPRQNGEAGAAWVYVRSGGSWSKLEQLTGGPEEVGRGRFGRSVSISADGSTAIVGAPGDGRNSGSAWIFTRGSSGFARTGAKLTGGSGEGFFGRSVAISSDGSTALVGSPAAEANGGAVYAFARSGDEWVRQGGALTGGGESGAGRFGFSLALSDDGSTALIGARNDGGGVGAAWAFTRSGSSWSQQGPKLTGSGESRLGLFGSSVSLSANGSMAIIGAPRDASSLGAAWIFTRGEGSWSSAEGKLAGSAPGGTFGASVALSSNEGVALVGAPRSDGQEGSVFSFLGTPLPAPQVAGVSPASGPSAGGTSVRIEGSGFLPGASVQIGGAASDVEVLSETELRATTGAHAGGEAQVVVEDLYGSSSGGPAFTYIAPEEPP